MSTMSTKYVTSFMTALITCRMALQDERSVFNAAQLISSIIQQKFLLSVMNINYLHEIEIKITRYLAIYQKLKANFFLGHHGKMKQLQVVDDGGATVTYL